MLQSREKKAYHVIRRHLALVAAFNNGQHQYGSNHTSDQQTKYNTESKKTKHFTGLKMRK